MTTDTTVMKNLLDWIESQSKQYTNLNSVVSIEFQKGQKDCYKGILEYAQRVDLLSKEKEQIEKAYFDGVERELNGDAISPQEYFNQTYLNK